MAMQPLSISTVTFEARWLCGCGDVQQSRSSHLDTCVHGTAWFVTHASLLAERVMFMPAVRAELLLVDAAHSYCACRTLQHCRLVEKLAAAGSVPRAPRLLRQLVCAHILAHSTMKGMSVGKALSTVAKLRV